MDFKAKNILVLGAGKSGVAVSKVLQDLGAKVTLSDSRKIETLNGDLLELTSLGVKLVFEHQNEQLLNEIDYLVLSPGVSIYHPVVQTAQSNGVYVMSEIEVAYELCPAPIVAVTGTNGKTTTTTLIGEMIKHSGKHVIVGGNIGTALSQEVATARHDSMVVAEVSSFQLEGVINFKPQIAAVLNLTPDHLDRHRTIEEYQLMKERIFSNQSKLDYLLLNYDDSAVRSMAERAQSQVFFFSRQQSLDAGIYIQDGVITIAWQGNIIPVCSIGLLKIRGAHNIENALAACGTAYLAGVSVEDMVKVLSSFQGVEHRIEPVATINGVTYYNDSKATNPESAIKALEAFDGNIILIAGGRDKNTDLSSFMSQIKQKTAHLILLGEAQERFNNEALKHGIGNIHHVDSFEQAVCLAHSLAQPEQVVLLSPACASYDMFKSYEERGRVFKELVYKLT